MSEEDWALEINLQAGEEVEGESEDEEEEEEEEGG